IVPLFNGISTVKYTVDAADLGDEIPNIVDNINVWEMGTQFYNPQKNEKYDVTKFVRYIQLMECSGGNEIRDLFKNPLDRSTLTDYDFTRLINNCRGILSLGAKPHLKLGNVPLKLTTDPSIGGFEVNVYPPDDYNQYYQYIRAIAQALVDEFGIEEVKSWRFGCLTEFENSDWFMAKNSKSKDSAIAYFKLYDYTVKALTDVIGEDVFVGAHAMAVTEGLWNVKDFIKHVGKGINYATGEKGTRICFLSTSFYDSCPGEFTSGKTLPKIFSDFKKWTSKYGLKDLIFGVDEGRILSGVTSGSETYALNTRTVGYTWQGAYDARLFAQAIKSGADYFSSWSFLSDGFFNGLPTMSYHVANNIYSFAGGRQARVDSAKVRAGLKIDTDCLASWNESEKKLRVMTYNFKNSLDYDGQMDVKMNIKVPQLDGHKVEITKYVLNDDCNYFDEWQEDRLKYNITDDCFLWSPDDPNLDSPATLNSQWARDIYLNQLKDRYEECAQLVPVKFTADVENGKLRLDETLSANNVVFYEIKSL
ncbi:MAG: hypothetical protein KBT46_07490, partial [Ruminococcus sp.]|nr:hypothetical protein [Candidatus Copronaster equi]